MANKKTNKFHKSAKELRDLLKASGLTQEKFAQKVGISRATYKNWISQNGVTYGNWAQITKALGHLLANTPFAEEEGPDFDTIFNKREALSMEIYHLAQELRAKVAIYDNLIKDFEDRIGGVSAQDPLKVNMDAARRLIDDWNRL